MTISKRFSLCYLLFLIFTGFSLITRSILLVKALPNLELSTPLIVKIYGAGFFFDVVTFAYCAIPFVLLTIILPDRVFTSRFFVPAVWTGLFAITYLLLFNMAAEYFFFDEFGTRFNFIAIDYLIYTTEVVRNIRESYPINTILGGLFVLTVLVTYALRRVVTLQCGDRTTLRQRLASSWPFVVLPLLSVFFVDLSLSNISPNNFAVELAGNGIYNLAAAFRNNELDYEKFYTTRDSKIVLARLKDLVRERNNSSAGDKQTDITRAIRGEGAERRLNVIVVVEESLSAEYLGAFGGTQRLTPNLDRLATQSLLFTHLYATGTRTVRGLEAITLSMPPLPGTSLVKRPGNEGFFSWGSVMQAKGYDNRFIYGGRGYFDNMNYFFAHNGFTTIDRRNFARDEVTFVNAWGVCDEDLFHKVVSEANISYGQRHPFFSMVMTTSNHRPFTYPDGTVDIPSHTGRDGGVKYADYAIGRFIAEAKGQPWFDDTIFVFVADHCAGSARKIALPVKNYEIPMIVYAPAHIRPQTVDTMASQIDIAPTVLGLLNFSYDTRFLGRDILKMAPGEGRAFISTYQKLGYLKDDRLLVLGPRREANLYRFSRQDGSTRELPPDESYLLEGLGYYQGTNFVYKHRLNRLAG